MNLGKEIFIIIFSYGIPQEDALEYLLREYPKNQRYIKKNVVKNIVGRPVKYSDAEVFLRLAGSSSLEDDLFPKVCHDLGGCYPIMKYFIEKGFSRNYDDLLEQAIIHGSTRTVRLLIRKEAKNGKGENSLSFPRQPMCYAAKGGHVHMIRFLLSRGADFHGFPLCDAVIHGRLGAVKYLLKSCIEEREQALVYAAEHGHLRIVKYLIGQGRLSIS